MKATLFIVFAFLSVGILAQGDSTETADRIYWSDWYKLEWADFQAQPEEGGSVAALSNIALPYDLVTDGEGELSVTLSVCFLKNQSWSKPQQRNQVLLQHEQLHFDIAELHKRKLVKGISSAEFSKQNYKEVLEKLIHEIWTIEYREMQDKYDKETNYSRFFKGQIKWNKFVAQQLRNLDEYKFNKVTVSLITFD